MAKKPTVEELLQIIESDPFLRQKLEEMRSLHRDDKQVSKYMEVAKSVMRVATTVLKLNPQLSATMVVVFDLVVPLSVYCKRNIIDNPEVQDFIKRAFQTSSSVAARGGAAALSIIRGVIEDQLHTDEGRKVAKVA
jgi:hypothetical protein